MKSRASRVIGSILGVAAIVAAACGSPAPQAETPDQGGRVVYGAIADISTLAPYLAADALSAVVFNLLYDPLMYPDPKTGEPKPNLGSWTISADGLTYNWTLNADATWTDGQPVIGRDYLVMAQLIAKSPTSPRKSQLRDIAGWADYVEGRSATISGIRIDGGDPKKFSVTFSRVYCPALVNAFGGTTPPLPAHVFAKYLATPASIDSAVEATQPTVFNGPFRFTEWRRGDQVILDRNPDYWRGSPLVDQFVYRVLPSSDAIAAQLKTGEITLGSIEPTSVADIGAQEGLAVHRFPSLSYVLIGWNTKSPTATMLADKRIRQALAYGLDMDSVVKNLLRGEGIRMVQHHPPVSWAAPDASTLNQYPYDRARAEQLIRDAGYTKGADGYYARDGNVLGFSIMAQPGHAVRTPLLEIAVEQYRQIGVRITPVSEAFQSIVSKISSGAADVEGYILSWSLGVEPDPTTPWHSSQIPDPAANKVGFNVARFSTPELDRAIDRGATGDCSQAARKAEYETVNRILNDEQPWNFGFSQNTLIVTPANLREVDAGSYGLFSNINKWWYKK